MRLSCNRCYKKTDMLWLRTINGRDYLLCRYHVWQEDTYGHRNEKQKANKG